jgi:ABC-type dipeptide/oligopeptide/nickel transport system permease subunit
MKPLQVAAIAFLLLLTGMCFCAASVLPGGYERQLRDLPDAPPSHSHPLGTDDLGRDRLARLLYGTCVSLLLAPAAALLSSVLAACIGGLAGFVGGWVERSIMACTDLFLSLPWLFLVITVRAMLPLNVSPLASAAITFALLGTLGWAASARVVCAHARSLRRADFVLLARASGSTGLRLLRRHLLPNLRPIFFAQFLISIPAFILTEANLGMLGLGVAEPMPSWGGLLRELEGFALFSPQPAQFVPLILLVIVTLAVLP